MTDRGIPRVSPTEVHANPDGQTSHRRWGPRWTEEDREGIWVIDTIWNIAVRVVDDESQPIVDASTFDGRINRAVEDVQFATADRYLEGLTPKARKPRKRAPKPAALDQLRNKVATGDIGGASDGVAR